jgi:diguanylate cyclase (GGDEF)-like protein
MYRPTDEYSKLAGTTEAKDIFRSIRALDTGVNNHEAWLSTVHKTLVCGDTHATPSDLRSDAHCHCKFGQWLYSNDTESLESIDVFHAVVKEHEQMHTLARNILTKSENRQEIVADEYGEFTAQATAFKLEVRNLQYELMSKVCVVDHLTGALNRYAMYSQLHQEKERQLRAGHPCAICMMDIDHFKRVNDEYGHTVGDQVLKSVIDYSRECLRKYDSIYRYGGEEFLFSLPDAEQDEVEAVIERLRAGLAEHPITLPDGEQLYVTASFGIACLTVASSVEDTIQAADHALLCAKAEGRNRICFWENGLSKNT